MTRTALLTVVISAAARVRRSKLVVASDVLRVLIVAATLTSIVLVLTGRINRIGAFGIVGTPVEIATVIGCIRFRLLRYRSLQIILAGGVVGIARTFVPDPYGTALSQIAKLMFAVGLLLFLLLGAGNNNERGQGLRPWIEAAIVWFALDAWFISALPRAWRSVSESASKIELFVVSPTTAVIVFVPTLLLLARLKVDRRTLGPFLFVAAWGLLWAGSIGNTANVAADGTSPITDAFVVLIIIACCALGLSVLDPSIILLANGKSPWRPQRAWARTAWLLVVPAVVIGAVSIGAHTWEGVLWPVLLLTSIGLLAVRTRLIAENLIARLNRRQTDGTSDLAPLDLESLLLWCAAIDAGRGTSSLELAVLVVEPSSSLDLPGPSGDSTTGPVATETVRRIREVMRGAQNLEPVWTGDWAVCHDRDRFILVHARVVPKSADPSLQVPSTRLAESLNGWLSLPFRTDEASLRFEFSIGYADRVNVPDAKFLIQDAIWAAHAAEPRLPRDYHAGDRTAARRRARLGAALDDALLDGAGLSVVFEPLVDVRTGQAIGAETLARWTTTHWGSVSPSEFIPIAEQTRSMLDLGEWVLQTACRAAAAQPSPRLIAVNLSGPEVAHPDLYRRVMRTIDSQGVDPSMVVLEITETVLADVVDTASESLRKLAAAGAKLSIDDFGTQASGLTRLLVLPWWSLKLDRSLITRLDSVDSQSAALVRAVSNLCSELGAKVVAEGVETAETLRLVTELGCQLAQGWVFGKGRPDLSDAWADQSPDGYVFPGAVPSPRR